MPTILFIHPDHKLIGIYRNHLSKHFLLDSAHDGLTGLRKIKATKPRVIVSEYRMPYLSGLSLLKYVRGNRDMHTTPFLFLTDHDMPEQALGMGASAWLKQSEHGPEALLRELALHV